MAVSERLQIPQNIAGSIIERLETAYKKDSAFSIEFYFKKNVSEEKPVQWFIKRAIDIVGTILGLILISPVLLLIILAIKLESQGPVLFKQKRMGKHGKEFEIYKFRSMYKNAEDRLGELIKYNQTNDFMFKMFDDPRVTKVGKFIRKYSLDELPQLINVLKGEMSLVGFRPPIPREVEKYKDWHYLRFNGTPGLTGPWQVNGRSTIKNFDKVVELEINYNKDWNLLKDIEIILKTFPVVLFGRDAA
ncbi:MAG TPA: sugar transferase [Candidatus Gastranaerophilales bacterium]|nr:sugar transferase [Candidatus Gastranaerophilales bacterium]